MWGAEGLDERPVEDWERLLREESVQEDGGLTVALSLALGVVRSCNEVFVGGDGSGAVMLQLLGAASEAAAAARDEVDVVTSVLLSAPDGVCVAFSERRGLRLLRSFWAWRPAAPLVVDAGGGRYEHVLCAVPGAAWTRGPLSLARLRALQAQGHERLEIHLPAAAPHRPAASAPEDKARTEALAEAGSRMRAVEELRGSTATSSE